MRSDMAKQKGVEREQIQELNRKSKSSHRSSNMPSSSSSSTFSGLRMSQSIVLSTRPHRSFESSNGRFVVLSDKLGFIAGLLMNTAVFNTFKPLPSPNSVSASTLFVG